MNGLNQVSWDEVMERMAEHIAARDKEMKLFWHSEICSRLIADMLKVGEPLDSETVLYCKDKIKEIYGWDDVSDDDLEKLFSAMAEAELFEGVPQFIQDEDAMFSTWRTQCRGLGVTKIHGQGTLIILSPLK